MAPARVFISHTHQDEQIATALRKALVDLFGDSVLVTYSTSKEEGGIQVGDDWIRWIGREVGQSKAALVLLTPTSVQKPWVLWEAGAVAGTALATSTDKQATPRKVRPVSYQLKSTEIPPPFRHLQIAEGDTVDGAKRLFESFFEDFELSVPKLTKAAQMLDSVATQHVQNVSQALLNAPMLPNEDVVQEWCLRLDSLRTQRRASEVAQVHDWLNVAFGRDRRDEARPIDLRLHRRLGELYLESRQYEPAAIQFELGRRLAPRDIFILRELGRAYLGNKRFDAAKQIINRIEELDAKAFVKNPECAAFLGRWHRDQGQKREAMSVFATAYKANPTSYYVGDLLGQLQLAEGDIAGARATYAEVLGAMAEIGEKNLWTHATAAMAAKVLGREEEAEAHMALVRAAGPTAENLKSIEGSLQRAAAAMSPAMAR